MKKEGILILFLFLIIAGFVSANFEIGDAPHSIDTEYAPSDYIKGWINISLNNEPANSIFYDSFENLISLIDLLKENTGFDYSCNPSDCLSDYSASTPEQTKTFELIGKSSKIIGLKFSGNINSINSISFTVESDVGSSCNNQLEIDFLNDGVIDMGNNKTSIISCSHLKSYGCFDESKDITLGTISSTPYCQRIKLSESPGFKLGVWVKNISGSVNLIMALYELDGDSTGAQCNLPPISGEGEIFCGIDYLITKSEDYYVCIYSDGGPGTHKIKGYSGLENVCGFHEFPDSDETSAYMIFAEGKRFKEIETLDMPNSLPEGTLSGKAYNYIQEKYGNLDCSSNDCIVPIKFNSGQSQTITIKNLNVNYDIVGFEDIVETNFYDLNETPATVNANFQKLYLDKGNFSVPDDYDDYDFLLDLNNEEILSEEITVEKVPIVKSLAPTITAAGVPTEFEVKVDSSRNITQYKWNFGDNSANKTSVSNKITHTYNSVGNYKLKVTVTDLVGKSSSKIFDVEVNAPIQVIDKMLNKKLTDLSNVKKQISNFSTFYQNSLNPILNLTDKEKKIENIQQRKANASSNQDYIDIVTDLFKIEIPESIITSKSTGLLSFYPEKDNINLGVLKIIGGGNYDTDEEDKYIDAITSWYQNNIETKIIFKELSAKGEYFTEPILKIFELEIEKKWNLSEDSYLILYELDDLKFKIDYSENEESGYIYIDLTEPKTTIEFSTTEDIDFTELPAFISPGLSELVVADSPFTGRTSKWTLFILIMFLLILVGFISYIILQEWYKKKYEIHLFKNKNNLYNLLTYIETSKKKGLKMGEISSKLKKVGWNSEQIRYVMRKYSGKRTGMFEILPVGKILSKVKKKNIKSPQGRNFPVRRRTFL